MSPIGGTFLLVMACAYVAVFFIAGRPDIGTYLLSMLAGPPLMFAVAVAVSRLFRQEGEPDPLSRESWMSDEGYASLLRAAAKPEGRGLRD